MTDFPILLFAAGKGTRMGALTENKPKPMILVAGKPLIDHALALVQTGGLQAPVINIHYHAQVLRDHLRGTDARFSDEGDMLRETGGGLRHAMPMLGASPAMTLNTDAVWSGPNPLIQLMNTWHAGMEALLLTVPPTRAKGHLGDGDFTIASDGQLTRGAGEIFTGAQIIRTDDLLNIDQDTFSMNVLWDRIAMRGGLYGTSYSGQWCDVGQPSSIAIAEQMLGFCDV